MGLCSSLWSKENQEKIDSPFVFFFFLSSVVLKFVFYDDQ